MPRETNELLGHMMPDNDVTRHSAISLFSPYIASQPGQALRGHFGR